MYISPNEEAVLSGSDFNVTPDAALAGKEEERNRTAAAAATAVKALLPESLRNAERNMLSFWKKNSMSESRRMA